MYTHVQGFSGQIVHLKLKWTHPTDNGWKKPWPKQLWQILVWRLRFSEGLWEASPKSWFFLFPWERHRVRLGEAVNTTSHLGGQLRAVGFVAWRPSRWPLSSSVLGPECYQPPRLSALRPALHTCGPPASHPRALGEGIRVLYKWPAWEGFPYGIGFNSMWLLFPFKLDSDWDSFLSGGSQLPRCCHFLFYISVFFFHLQDFFFFFCHQKNTRELRVPSWSWLNQCWQFSPSCLGPSSSTISNTVMHITQHCDLI